MGSKKIVVSKAILDDRNKERITAAAARHGYTVEFFKTNKDAVEALRDAEIAYGMGPKLVKHSPQLKWFCSAAAGVNNILIDGLIASPDVQITCATGSYGVTIAEHTICVLLEMMRQLPTYAEYVRRHEWKQNLIQHSIYGSSILILGTGDIGQSIARRLKAFEPARVIGINRSGRPAGPDFDAVYPSSQLDDHIADADCVILCMPETKETIGILSAERIAHLKETAYVVNVGRGSAICQSALIAALNEGKIAGAALDVLEHEPLEPDDPVWETKNLLLTPHISGQETLQYTLDRNVDIFLEDLENYCAGRPLKYLVDRKLGYQQKHD